MKMEHMYILIIVAAFILTTLYYILLYRRLRTREAEIPRFKEVEEPSLEEDALKNLRRALARDKHSLEELLIELKKIRKQAEELLDDR